MKQCAFCGNDFDNQKSKTIYCSGKCRTYAFRLRKKEVLVIATAPSKTTVQEKKGFNIVHETTKIKNAQVGQTLNKQMPKGLSLQEQIDWKINNL